MFPLKFFFLKFHLSNLHLFQMVFLLVVFSLKLLKKALLCNLFQIESPPSILSPKQPQKPAPLHLPSYQNFLIKL